MIKQTAKHPTGSRENGRNYSTLTKLRLLSAVFRKLLPYYDDWRQESITPKYMFLLFTLAGLIFVTPLTPTPLLAMPEINESLEEFYEMNDIPHFEEKYLCEINDYGSLSGPVTLVGSDNLEKIYNFFKSKGLSDIQAAAVVGNIYQESKGNPTLSQGGGNLKDPSGLTCSGYGCGRAWGIVQWDPGSLAITYAKEAGISGPIHELSTQLQLVWWHMNNRSLTGVMDMLNKKPSAGVISRLNTKIDKGGDGKPYGVTRVPENGFNTYREAGPGGVGATIIEATKYFDITMEGSGTPNMVKRVSAAMAALKSYADNSATVGNISSQDGCECIDISIDDSSTAGGKKYNLGNVRPYVQRVADHVGNKFGVGTIGGYRPRSTSRDTSGHGHGDGVAIDIMTNDDGRGMDKAKNKAYGDPIFEYLKANAKNFGIYYIIWQQKHYGFDKDGKPGRGGGWKGQMMENRGSITANHYDHVHVSFRNEADGLKDSDVTVEGAVGVNECEGQSVLGNSVTTAINFAWPTTNDNKEPKKEYKTIYDKNKAESKSSYTDSALFISYVMKESGFDNSCPTTISEQVKYLSEEKEKYKEIKVKSTADLEPGDIVIYASRGGGQTYLWVGEKDGFNGTAVGALSGKSAPRAMKTAPITAQSSGVEYQVFRLKDVPSVNGTPSTTTSKNDLGVLDD